VTCLQNVEANLIAHPHQGGQYELEHHPTLVGHQVPHVLQDVVARPVEVAVAEVGRDQAVLELRVLLLLVDVQQAEPLARGSTNHDVNLALPWHASAVISLLCFLQQAIAVFIDHRAIWVILLEGICRRFPELNCPSRCGCASLVEALAEPPAASKDVQALERLDRGQ